MNTKHTPGPWKHTTPQGAFGHEIIGPDGHLICKMQHHPDEQKQAADDAALIAAAPALFEILSLMLGAAELECLDDKSNVWRSAMIDARAALAEAEGGEHANL